ncbi:class I SAM-dependent methyltransferase [Mobilicoccus massiliensis]|uniref:class I SAM-dependent methyltransferase n=1 Tax=Mobilicoccus massiliensis TaxID=1522310 RepID=UPI0009E4AFB6|nr:class I SAM-dependent methyltransferase [Mobilicoccus massiliensis]
MTDATPDPADASDTASAPGTPAPPMPTRPVEADWLTLRRPADEAAREGTQRLLTRLWRDLRTCAGPEHEQRPVRIVDVGAGTGANQAWLAPRLPFPATWTLLDHDADLLHHPVATGQGTRVHGGLDDLPRLVEADGTLTVVVGSALLDLLTYDELDTLATLLVETATPALFSLSVDGAVNLVPADDDDTLVADAFDAHQRRDGLAGASAADHFSSRLREAGAEVVDATTPWRLTAAQPDLLRRYLTDRAAVAVEHDPALADRVEAWLERRLQQVDAGTLAVVVGHVDLLALPR